MNWVLAIWPHLLDHPAGSVPTDRQCSRSLIRTSVCQADRHPTHVPHRHRDLPLQASAAEAERGPAGGAGDRAEGAAKPETPPAPANDDRKSAIVTARRPGARSSVDVPDLTLEEHQRRGDAADALFRQIVRRATE